MFIKLFGGNVHSKKSLFRVDFLVEFHHFLHVLLINDQDVLLEVLRYCKAAADLYLAAVDCAKEHSYH